MTRSTLNSILFLVLGLAWGLNYLWAKQALAFLDPKEILFLRCLFAAVPLAVLAAFQGHLRLEHLRAWPHLVVMSVLTASLYYYLFKHGIDRLDSGIAAAISGAIPIVTFIGTWLFLHDERISVFKLVGLGFGVVGVVVLAQPWTVGEGGRDPLGVAAVLAACVCIGASFVYARLFINKLGIPPVSLVTYSFGLATLTVMPFVDYGAIWQTREQAGVLWGVVLGNGVFGSGIAAFIYYVLVRQWGAIPASSTTLVPPAVGLFVGWLVLSESITVLDASATAGIILGVVLLRRD